MHPSFASKLPPIDAASHLPRDSAVFTLTRRIDSAAAGDGPHSEELLSTARQLKTSGYLRTALTYFALGTRRDLEHCLLVEPDGFAYESHLITGHIRQTGESQRLYVGQNPESETWFWLKPEGEDVRALYANVGARMGGVEIPLHREISSPSGTGVILATCRCFDLGPNELMDVADFRSQRMFRPLAKQPSRGQLDPFAGTPIQGT